MKLHMVAAVAVGLLVGANPPRPGGVSEELGSLRGEWRLVSTADAQRTDVGNDLVRMTVADDGRVVLKFGDQTTNQGTVTTRRSGAARLLDLRLASGQTVFGVYDCFGDELVICCDHAGKARPATLVPTGTQWTERWRRVLTEAR